MTRTLHSKRRPPHGGQTDSVVIFLHGYGADGADLLGLADVMGPHLPHTVFFAPNAPEQSHVNPMGRQWFPIPWIDGSSQHDAETGVTRAAADLNAYLDQTMAAEHVAPHRVALVGFSQGTMMALHVGPRRPHAIGGIVGFSGKLLLPDTLRNDVIVRPPVLLLHGDTDDVVPPTCLPEAAQALKNAGWSEAQVRTHIMKGTAHGIAPDGIGAAVAFLKDRFGLS